MKNLEPCSFPVNTDCRSAMGTNEVAFIANINKPVYGGFFIGKPVVKFVV
jgi:hypothetical protein